MPKLDFTRRGKVWEIKTRPSLLHPVLASKHNFMAEQIMQTYTSIDKAYNVASKILDEKNISSQNRIIYRAWLEELWKIREKFRRETLILTAVSLYIKYVFMGGEREVLREVAQVLGIIIPSDEFIIARFIELMDMRNVIYEGVKKALQETLEKVETDVTDSEIEYDAEGRIMRIVKTDKILNRKKEIKFFYDAVGNLIRLEQNWI